MITLRELKQVLEEMEFPDDWFVCAYEGFEGRGLCIYESNGEELPKGWISTDDGYAKKCR